MEVSYQVRVRGSSAEGSPEIIVDGSQIIAPEGQCNISYLFLFPFIFIYALSVFPFLSYFAIELQFQRMMYALSMFFISTLS